jgi:hypothetical protein
MQSATSCAGQGVSRSGRAGRLNGAGKKKARQLVPGLKSLGEDA